MLDIFNNKSIINLSARENKQKGLKKMTKQEVLNNVNQEIAFLISKRIKNGMSIDEAKSQVFSILERDYPDFVNVFISQN